MSIYRRCIGCGILIEKPFWLCQTCADLFEVDGKRLSMWPQYLKDLRNYERRFERQDRHIALSLSIVGGELRDPAEGNCVPFQRSPYEYEGLNKIYRQANDL